jgi:Zn-finger nucleic acid-binding protein
MDLTCPKCQGAMRSYERSGVIVDQCTECRGIFLDRGELDKLVDAENSWHKSAPRGAPAPQPGYHEPALQQPPRRQYDQQHHGGYKPHKKRKSFLDELFD